MSRFDLYAPGNKPVSFTQFEKETIEAAFPAGESPIHFAFRTDIRVKKETHRNEICAVSPHFIACFRQKTYGEKPEMYYKLHISNIQMLCYSDDPFVFIKTAEDKLTVTGHQCLTFAQIIYRNYQLTFPNITLEEIFELRAPDMSKFPLIQLPTSLSQVFQFGYSNYASLSGVPYRQEVVRFIHNMIITKNPILDLSQLPADLFVDSQKSSAFDPIFNALHTTKIGHGICCVDQPRPRLLYSLAESVEKGLDFKIIHFENCGIVDGMQQFKDAIFKKDDFPCYYWNLDNNKIKGWNNFFEILSKQKTPLKHLSLANTGMNSKELVQLFNTLKENNNLWEIRSLCMAGTSFDNKSIAAVRDFINTLADNNSMKIVSLNLSNCQKINEIFHILSTSPTELRDFNISKCNLDKNSTEDIITIIQNSHTLKHIDISYTRVTPEFVARLITEISKNEDLKEIELNLSGLNLTGTKLIPVITAFLNSDEHKWHSLFLDDNSMNSEDVKNLTSVFQDFTSMFEISLSYNFNDKMRGVGQLLGELLAMDSIKKISLRGTNENCLKQELVPFLRKASKAGLEYLDISNQCLGDNDYSSIAQFVRQCTTLQSIKFDGNNVTSIELLLDLVAAINSNKNVSLAYFPVNDAHTMVAKAKSQQKNGLMQRLGDIQISLMQYVNSHRYNLKLPNVLPFETSQETQEIIDDISGEYVQWLNGFRDLRVHTAACKELNLPLPFQRMGDVVEDGGEIGTLEIGALEVYKTESMRYTIREDSTNYETLAYTHANPNFLTVVENEQRDGHVSFVERSLENSPEKAEEHQVEEKVENEEIVEEKPKRQKKKKINYYEDDSDDDEKLQKFEKRKYKEEIDSDDEKVTQFTKKRDYNDIDDTGKRKRLYGALPQPKKEKRRLDNEGRKQRRPFDTVNDVEVDEIVEEKKSSKRKLDLSDSDEEKPKKKTSKRRFDYSDDDEPVKPQKKSPKRRFDDSDDDEPVKPQKKSPKRRFDDSDEEIEQKKPSKRRFNDSEDEEPLKPQKKQSKRRLDDSEDDEQPKKNSKKQKIIPIDIPEHESIIDDDESESDQPVKKPQKKSSSSQKKSKYNWSDDEEELDDAPKPKKKARNQELDDTPVPTQFLAHQRHGKK